MDEEKRIEFVKRIIELTHKPTVINNIHIIVQEIFQYGYEIGSQETAAELGKQIEQQLKQAFKGF